MDIKRMLANFFVDSHRNRRLILMIDLDLLLCPAISNAAANIFLTDSYL
jgi:hypothetical protein